ncbi:MAG: MFS transporter, partial [Propionibacteriaceae bacterium]
TLRSSFGLTPPQAALSMSVTTIALGVTLLFLGPISDSIGRVTVMRWSLLLSALLTIGVGLAPSWNAVLVLRALVGISVAGLPAVAVAYLREEIDPHAIARATGRYIGGTAIGGMAGRLVAGIIDDLCGWRWAVVCVGLLALACGIACWFLIPASRGFQPQPLAPRALARRTWLALRDRRLLALNLIGLISMGALNAIFNAVTFRLVAAPYFLASGIMSLIFLMYLCGSWASARAGRMADQSGPLWVVRGALVLGLLGTLLTLATPLSLVLLGVAGVTMGFFATHGVASSWVTAHAQRNGHGMGQATSLYLFFYYVGASSMGYVGGWAWASGAWNRVALVCTMLWLIGLGATLVLGPQRHRNTPNG